MPEPRGRKSLQHNRWMAEMMVSENKYSYRAILIIYSKYKKQTNPFRKMKGCVINDVTAAGEKNRGESVNENKEATRPLSCFLQGSVLGVHSIQQEISNKIATKCRSSFS